MLKTNINLGKNQGTNSAIEFVQWPVKSIVEQNAIEKKVLAIQTTRIPPFNLSNNSISSYQGFNLGLHVDDCAKQVNKNRQLLQKLLPQNASIQWFEQVHGNDVVEISQVTSQALVADAAITQVENVCLAIMTADCLPIMLVSKNGDEVAAIHGGWRPLSTDIIKNTITKMNTPPADIYAWLGPCISKSAFEIGNEVKDIFVKKNVKFTAAFLAKANGKYVADLPLIAKIQLENLGVNNFSCLPECTYTNTEKYYSYRKNAITGRMATLICLL